MNNIIDVSIIIVTWNSEAWIKRCIASIIKHTSDISYEIIVIDNNSSDHSVRIAMNEFSDIKVIENRTNKGWATGINQGIEVANGRYLCLLNPDTEVFDRTIEQLVAFMDQYSKVGVVGPHLINEDESTQISIRRRPRLADQLMIILKLHVLFPNSKAIFKYLYRDFNYSQTQEVEQIMGACMLVRKEVIEQVGIFDENFFLWFDEVDFCYRVYERTDYQIFYDANSHLIHAGGHSFGQVGSHKKQGWYLKSLRYFFKKHGQWFAYFVILFFTPLSRILGVLGGMFKQSKKGKEVEAKTQDAFKKTE